MHRREFLRGAGALIVSFSISLPALAQAPPDPKLQQLDAWLAVEADSRITVYTGKVELGTGVQTALAQIVADEFDVDFDRVRMVMGDTALCPNQGPTVGSQTIYRAGPQLRAAAAEARQTLFGFAAIRLGAPADQLTAAAGVVSAADGKKVSYGELIDNQKFNQKISGTARPKSPERLAARSRCSKRSLRSLAGIPARARRVSAQAWAAAWPSCNTTITAATRR